MCWVVLMAMAGTLAALLVNVDQTTSTCFLFYPRALLSALSGREATAALLPLLFIWLHTRYAFAPYQWRRWDRIRLGLMTAVFAFAASVGAAYSADDGVLAEFLAPYHIALLAGKAIGFGALFFVGMKALLMALPTLSARVALTGAELSGQSVRRVFWQAALVIGCAWLPSFIAHYPGFITADGGRVLQQFFGEIVATADHPLVYTALLGSVVWLDKAIAGDEFGLFLYTFLQWVFLLSTMAWSVAEFTRKNCPKGFRYALFTLLVRHNGVMTVVPATVVLTIRFLCVGKPQKRWKAGLLAAPVCVLVLFNSVVVPRVALPVESTADLLGVAIQQTARIVKNAPQDVNDEAFAAIDRVLEADQRVPIQSDSVRKLYRYFNGHTRADVLAFAGVAARQIAMHPLTSLHAFWSLSGGFLDPFNVTNTRFNTAISDTSPKYPQSIYIELPAKLTAFQDRLLSIETSYGSLPLLSQLQSIGLFTWTILIGWFLVGRTRYRRLRWLLLAPMTTLAARLLSAGFAIGSRYALPIVYTVPYLLCVLAGPVLKDAAERPRITEVRPSKQKVEKEG